MRRGEIYEISFDPTKGSESRGQRPAVVVSRDSHNARTSQLRRGVVTVVPITSGDSPIYAFQVALRGLDTDGLTRDSKAQCEQVRSVDYARFRKESVGSVSREVMRLIDGELRRYLDLE